MDKNVTSSEFRRELVDKYGEKYINASGYKACALMVVQHQMLKIKDGLSISDEEDLIYSYLNRDVKISEEKQSLNNSQDGFITNCCIDVINQSPNLFKESLISNNEGIKMAIFALGSIGTMGDQKINDKFTTLDLQNDLFFLYFKMYVDYLKGGGIKNKLNPNNQYKAKQKTETKTNNGNNGCLGTVVFIAIILTSLITFSLN